MNNLMPANNIAKRINKRKEDRKYMSTRFRKSIILPTKRKNITQKSIDYKAMELYARVPKEIRSCRYSKFRELIRNYVIDIEYE